MELNKNLLLENKKDKILTLVLILSIIIGFLIRIKGLGKWPLTVDEYYIVESIKSILKNGLPSFKYGGYYDRGILYQYLTSLLLLGGIKVELAARIIPVITNILIVHPLYLLSRKVSGKTAATAIIFVFCFSVWEVEFARFARMYSPFQLIFAWYLYFLYKNLIEDDSRSLKWLFILSFISIFVYEASIFLSILNFLPFIWDSKKRTTLDGCSINFSKVLTPNKKFIAGLAAAVIIFITAYIFISFNFRTMGQHNLLPPSINLNEQGGGSSRFRIPLILLTTLSSNLLWTALCLIPIGVSVFCIIKVKNNQAISPSAKLSFLVLAVLSFLNLFGLVIFLLILFLLLNLVTTNDLKKLYKFLLISAGVSFIFWSVYSLSNSEWHYYFYPHKISGTFYSLKILWKEFTNYPYLYETYVLFRNTIPKLTALTIVLLTAGLFITIFFKNNKKEEFKFLFFIFLLLVLMVSTLNLGYFKTRYFFFLFPLLILLEISTIERILKKFFADSRKRVIGFIILCAAFIFISEDFNIKHLYNIDSREVNYRIGYSRELKDHYYPRWDVKTPDEYVNKRLKKGDIVIINEQLNSFYLKRVNYIYKDYTDNFEFGSFSILGGRKERWTGADLIYKSSDLTNLLLKGDETKWLVLNTVWGIRFLEADSFFVKFKKYEVFANSDTSTIVYKIPPKPALEAKK